MEITLKNYKKLLTKIQQTIAKTQKNIVQLVDYQKILMSWEIGKEIEGHLEGKDKSNYGEKLFDQLTVDTGISRTALYQMRAFYKAYPKIPSQKNSLSWSHYRNLIAVKDEETRQRLESLVVEKSLGSNRLQKEIAAVKKKKTSPNKANEKIPQLKVKRGKLGTYTLTKNGAKGIEIDLGFNVFLSSSAADVIVNTGKYPSSLSSEEKLKRSFASLRMTGGGMMKEEEGVVKMTEQKKSDYTYVATLERVVDGDTIHVKIDLGFGIMRREIIRLAKINAAESKTMEGKKATLALKKILDGVPFLILRTNKTDIYGRYVADVFFDENKSETNPQKVADSGTYLNQLLLDRGLVEIFS